MHKKNQNKGLPRLPCPQEGCISSHLSLREQDFRAWTNVLMHRSVKEMLPILISHHVISWVKMLFYKVFLNELLLYT